MYSYLEKSGASGLFLCLEMNLDSIVSAWTVNLMCEMIVEQYEGSDNIQAFLKRVNNHKPY